MARIVIVGSIALALTAPGQTAAVSVLVNPLQSGLHLSSASVSGAYLVGSVAGAGTLPLLGWTIDRWGPRLVMSLIGALFGSILLGLSTVTGIVGLTAGFIGIRLMGQGALSLTATTTVALYVQRRRGLAQGITTAIGGAGISLTPALLETLVLHHGFRWVWFVEGLFIWVTVIPLARVGLPRSLSPARHATGYAARHWQPGVVSPQVAPGIEETMPASVATGVRAADQVPDCTLREAVGTGIFWLVAVGVATSAMLGTALTFHQIAILGERGLSPSAAAANFIPQTIAGVLATLATGYLADKLADRVLICVSMLVLVTALVAAGYLTPGWSAFGYAAAVGAAVNMIRTLEATAFPRCFGLAHIGAIRGVVYAAGVVSAGFGPLLFSLGRDHSTSYRPVLLLAALLPAALAVIAPLIRPRRVPSAP